jgi:hypothetical protein
MRKHCSHVCKLRPCLDKETNNSARKLTIVAAALQRQYSQTELIFWITYVHNNTNKKKIGKCGPCPVFASYTLAFTLKLMKKHGKTSVRVVEKCPYIPVQHTFTHNNTQNNTMRQNTPNGIYITNRIQEHKDAILFCHFLISGRHNPHHVFTLLVSNTLKVV